ncbi:acetyltransferase [Xanthocytophaga flava]|uniref:acetyltransferase n=1 Tax=Xanthocytophaga flava TaxID=3048013 RepID=UPI0028D50DA8|nr:acetyltransferase [Xanthocytophaga flavus]MDJ1472097.1 acetyltransferase [Xanthocytophaga flavus]
MENPVIIFGAKGLGRVALDIFQSNEVVVYGFLDDDKQLHNTEIMDISVLGDTDDDGFLKLIGKKCEAFIATDDNKLRKHLVEVLLEKRKIMPVNAIHKQAYIAPSASISHGNLISAGVIINSAASVGSHCILHANTVVDYETTLGDLVQVGTGSIIGSGVTIENGTFIGSGVTIVSGITIGKNARIGAGSVVIENVKAGATVFGNPAKVIER